MIKLIVTDGTGVKSSPARVIQVVKDPSGAISSALQPGSILPRTGGVGPAIPG
jgi:hypothetical protein